MTRLKLVGVRQQTIAERAGVTQGTVSRVLSRHFKGNETAESVWRQVERALVAPGSRLAPSDHENG